MQARPVLLKLKNEEGQTAQRSPVAAMVSPSMQGRTPTTTLLGGGRGAVKWQLEVRGGGHGLTQKAGAHTHHHLGRGGGGGGQWGVRWQLGGSC